MSNCISSDSPLGVFNLTGENAVPQGANWQVKIQYFDTTGTIIDLSTYTAEAQIRNSYGGTIIMDLTSQAGTIILSSGASNTPNVVLNFTPALTSNVTTYTGMIYDIKLISSTGNVIKFLEGNFSLHRTITP